MVQWWREKKCWTWNKRYTFNMWINSNSKRCTLAEAANCHYHVCHISAKESVRAVREGKKNGIKVTCEVTPHHLLSCDEDIKEDNGMWKMNPPLRSREDRNALIVGILDGTIDIIATDHLHTLWKKNKRNRKIFIWYSWLRNCFCTTLYKVC